MGNETILDKGMFSTVWKGSCKRRRKNEEKGTQIYEKDCDGRCAILHSERCPLYEDGKCKFPETTKANEILDKEKGKINKKGEEKMTIEEIDRIIKNLKSDITALEGEKADWEVKRRILIRGNRW